MRQSAEMISSWSFLGSIQTTVLVKLNADRSVEEAQVLATSRFETIRMVPANVAFPGTANVTVTAHPGAVVVDDGA
jgi:hypothetical protein